MSFRNFKKNFIIFLKVLLIIFIIILVIIAILIILFLSISLYNVFKPLFKKEF